jgi:hypothetical protein
MLYTPSIQNPNTHRQTDRQTDFLARTAAAALLKFTPAINPQTRKNTQDNKGEAKKEWMHAAA